MQKDTLDYEEEKHMKLDCRMNRFMEPSCPALRVTAIKKFAEKDTRVIKFILQCK